MDEPAPATNATAPSTPMPARPSRWRTAAVVVDVLVVAAVVGSVVAVLVGVRALLDVVDRVRRAVGDSPPVDGVDWVTLVALAVVMAALAALVWFGQRAVLRRHQRRLAAVVGGSGVPLGRGPSRRLERGRWIAALLQTPGWRDAVAEWQRDSRLSPGATERVAAGNGTAHVAELISARLSEQIGERALATGMAVAVARSRAGDAAAVVGGSVAIQLDALAALGLRPTPATYLRIARSAAAGITAASYLDVEDRLELDLAVRAAVFGLDLAGDAADLADDAISEDLADALSDTLASGGGTVGTLLNLVGGAFGVSGSMLRQVADVTETVGGQITEGLVIAALLHHQGMTLVAECLAGDDAELRARLTPPAAAVPRQLFDAGVAVARRYRGALRRLLRERTTRAARSAPRRITRLRRGRDNT